MENKRIEWIDIAKGIGIIIVVLGHCVPYGGFAFNFIFAFHMPLFFILSGYCFKPRDIRTTLDNKVKSLIIPFIKYATLGLIVTLIIPTLRRKLTLKDLARDIYLASPDGCNNSSIWFLSCLFFVTVMTTIAYSLTEKIRHKNVVRICLVIVSTVIGYAVSIDLVFMKMLPGDRMPFAVDTAFMAIFFFAIGFLLKKKSLNCTRRGIYVMLILSVLITVLAVRFNGKVNIHALVYKNVFIYIIGALAGSLIIILLSLLIEDKMSGKVKQMLIWYGQKSLVILGTQSLLIRLFILIENQLKGTEYILYRLPILDGLICFIIVTFLISPVLCSISDKLKKRSN